jgi:hypothetical protein
VLLQRRQRLLRELLDLRVLALAGGVAELQHRLGVPGDVTVQPRPVELLALQLLELLEHRLLVRFELLRHLHARLLGDLLELLAGLLVVLADLPGHLLDLVVLGLLLGELGGLDLELVVRRGELDELLVHVLALALPPGLLPAAGLTLLPRLPAARLLGRPALRLAGLLRLFALLGLTCRAGRAGVVLGRRGL